MRLAFVDFIYHYDAARPEADEPLGGTTSAICFLARELVKTGAVCAFYNRVTEPRSAHGITSYPLRDLAAALETNAYDAYIFCGRWRKEMAELVRANTRAPFIAWMHESVFQAPVTEALDAFDGVVYVSLWQKCVNQHLVRPRWKQTIIRNAMNPAVADSFPAGTKIFSVKVKPPVLLFAGSFARGAFHIPPLLDKIRPHRTDFSVEMYCNLDPSRDPEKDAAYIGWLRSLPNIAHVGMVGQTELAQRMKRADVLLAPNPWPETSCIALIEALASGMAAVTTARAALPETASGFARQIPIDAPDDPLRFDMPIDYDAFAVQVLEALRAREENPDAEEKRMREQVDYFHAHYQWAQRVAPWLDFLKELGA
ncbi:MAG: glycosyltransferase family 4 protein [Alphaproteobacteria bacterium]|nr:glycosyltransferase family 4 protein [Alphaproteobacteria bacterium]